MTVFFILNFSAVSAITIFLLADFVSEKNRLFTRLRGQQVKPENLLLNTLRRIFQGLRRKRDVPALLAQGGFRTHQIASGYLATFPKSLSYCWWGPVLKNTIE